MTEFLAEALGKEVEYGIQELVFDFAACFVVLFQFGSVSVKTHVSLHVFKTMYVFCRGFSFKRSRCFPHF